MPALSFQEPRMAEARSVSAANSVEGAAVTVADAEEVVESDTDCEGAAVAAGAVVVVASPCCEAGASVVVVGAVVVTSALFEVTMLTILTEAILSINTQATTVIRILLILLIFNSL